MTRAGHLVPPRRSRPAPVLVESEWARLREVVVGRPFLRIPQPFPRRIRPRTGAAIWSWIQARQGEVLADAFPRLHALVACQMRGAVRLLRQYGVVVREVPSFEAEEEPRGAAASLSCFQYFTRDPLLVVGDLVIELATRGAGPCPQLLPMRRLLDSLLRGRAARRTAMPGCPPGARHCRRPARLEGGDCLVTPSEVFVGVSGGGSNRAGVAWLRRTLEGERAVTPVPVAREARHLDMALCLVRPGLGIRCLAWLPGRLPAPLRDWEWIEVSREVAAGRLAVNCLPIDEATTLVPVEVPRVADALARRGQRVVTTPFSAMVPHAGGLRCWSNPLRRAG